MKRLITILLLLSVFWANDKNNLNDPGFELYSKGYLDIINEEWSNSIRIFKTLVTKYPSSDYADDATFWIAYSQKELGEYVHSFDTFFILINKYPNSNLIDKGINERIEIAKILAKTNNTRFITFLKTGGDLTNSLIQKYNKLKLYKERVVDLEFQKDQLIAKMNLINFRSQNSGKTGFTVKTSKRIDDIFNNDENNPSKIAKDALTTYNKIETMKGEIEYHDKIADKTYNEIEFSLQKFQPYLNNEDLNQIVKRFNSINLEFYDAYKHIEKKEWVIARDKFKDFLTKYPDHNEANISKFWLAYASKEIEDYSTSFEMFGEVLQNTSDKYLIEETKINRIMIASTLARNGNQTFLAFLENGSDFKDELYNLYSELIKISDDDTKTKLNRLFSINSNELLEVLNQKKFSNIASNDLYKENLLDKLNEVANKVKVFYGTYKIDLVNIVK